MLIIARFKSISLLFFFKFILFSKRVSYRACLSYDENMFLSISTSSHFSLTGNTLSRSVYCGFFFLSWFIFLYLFLSLSLPFSLYLSILILRDPQPFNLTAGLPTSPVLSLISREHILITASLEPGTHEHAHISFFGFVLFFFFCLHFSDGFSLFCFSSLFNWR